MDRRRAEQFCRSYEDASRRGDPMAIASHYGFPFTAFTLGDVSTFTDREEANGRVAWQLDRIASTGVGNDIRLDGLEIVAVSEYLALCHLTWSIRPTNGTSPWTWTNVYALREAAGTLYFEAAFADNEIAELLKRFPDAYST